MTSDYDQVITLSKTKKNWNATPDRGEKPKPASRDHLGSVPGVEDQPEGHADDAPEGAEPASPPSPSPVRARLRVRLARAARAGWFRTITRITTRSPRTATPASATRSGTARGCSTATARARTARRFRSSTPGITVKDIYRTPERHACTRRTSPRTSSTSTTRASARKKPYGDLAGRQLCTGNANFWKIYRKYFGSTYSDPRLRRVFRFKNRSNGTYYYTTSVTQRYHLAANHTKSWAYGGGHVLDGHLRAGDSDKAGIPLLQQGDPQVLLHSLWREVPCTAHRERAQDVEVRRHRIPCLDEDRYGQRASVQAAQSVEPAHTS